MMDPFLLDEDVERPRPKTWEQIGSGAGVGAAMTLGGAGALASRRAGQSMWPDAMFGIGSIPFANWVGGQVGGLIDRLGPPGEPRLKDKPNFADRDDQGVEERQAAGLSRSLPKPMPELRSYDPSLRERLGAYIAGDDRDSWRNNLAERLVGTTGLGESTKTSLGGITGLSHGADAYTDAERGKYGHAAVNAALAAASASGVMMAPKAIAGAMRQPFLKHAPEEFTIPFATKNGPGRMWGQVDGTSAYINGAYTNNHRGTAGSAGPKEILRVARELQQQYPYIDKVEALRVSGARKAAGGSGRLELNLKPGWKTSP